MVLPSLEGQQEIVTVAQPPSGLHEPPDLSNLRPIRRKQRLALSREFVWKIVPPEERVVPKVHVEKKKVGVEMDDTRHLNKRRQKARVRKVTEAILKLKGGLPFTKELKEIASIPFTNNI